MPLRKEQRTINHAMGYNSYAPFFLLILSNSLYCVLFAINLVIKHKGTHTHIHTHNCNLNGALELKVVHSLPQESNRRALQLSFGTEFSLCSMKGNITFRYQKSKGS